MKSISQFQESKVGDCEKVIGQCLQMEVLRKEFALETSATTYCYWKLMLVRMEMIDVAMIILTDNELVRSLKRFILCFISLINLRQNQW